MKRPQEQTERFIDFMLAHVPELDVAAARYNPDGKVTQVLSSKRRIAAVDVASRAAVLPWLRARNTEVANIWVRPAATLEAHPLVMLDDLQPARALAICRKYAGAVVETSPGNSQVWIVLCKPLGRHERQIVASALCELIGADRGAISEPRWGRLPGFRQRKPGKKGWTNLLSVGDGPALDPTPYLVGGLPDQPAVAALPPNGAGGPSHLPSSGTGRDESKAEFKFSVCALRAGVPEDQVAAAVAARAMARGKRHTPEQAARYGRKTAAAAAREVFN